MTFVHRVIKVKQGEQIELLDSTIIAGTNLEPDGKGGWDVAVHVLERSDGFTIPQGAITQ
jgi:hypothetical protein